MRRIVTALSAVALAFSLVSFATPANAAAGFDSQWSGESAFLSLKPGDTGTFTVFFGNTGTTSWVKGTSSQVDLAACLEDKVSCNQQDTSEAGFNPGTWTSATRYATHSQTTVAPGSIGTFTYDVKVPSTQVPGTFRFNGALVVSGTGADVHNEGYYHDATVTVTTTIKIDSVTPASPSSNQTPVVAGSGATSGDTVTIMDGTTSVGTGTATSTGTFSITTSTLAEGSHTLTASTPQQTSAASTYVVDVTKPKVSSATSASLTKATVTFNENMNCASIGTATWTVKDINGTASGGTITAAGVSTSTTGTTDCLTATVTASTALTNGTQYTVAVTGGTDAAGNTTDTAANSATFVSSDTTTPTATSAAFQSSTTIKITFSEPVQLTNTGNGARNIANYTYDGQSGSTAFTTCGANATTFADNVTCTLGVAATGTATTPVTHTITVANYKDAGGNLSGTSTLTAVYPPETVRPTITSVTSPNLAQIVVTYSEKMILTGTGDTDACARYAVTKADGTASGVACAAVSADSAAKVMTISVTPNMTGATSYNLITTDSADVFGNVISPNPTTTAFTATADTTKPTVVSASTPSSTTCDVASTAPCNQTQFTVTWSESMTNAALILGTNYALPTTARSTTGATIGAFTCAATDSAGTASTKAATCTFTTPIQPGTYVLTISNQTDLSTNASDPSPATVNVTFGDTTKPTANAVASASGAPSSTISLPFSEVMETAGGAGGASSVLNPANYKIDNVALTTSNTTIACGTAAAGVFTAGACNSVVLTITTAEVIATGANPHTITISNVKDLGGNALNPTPSTLAFNAT